jgi:hypothetical protein
MTDAVAIQGIRRKITEKHLLLNAPLSESAVSSFESRHRIKLPKGYREFLLHIGNGGSGPPHYGLAALGEVARDMSDSQKRVYGDLADVSKEFLFVEPWIWEEDERTEAFRNKMRSVDFGNLFLGNDGCGQYWILIVSGSVAGQVWQRTDVGIQPCAPPREFLDWYEYWLDGRSDWWAGSSS